MNKKNTKSSIYGLNDLNIICKKGRSNILSSFFTSSRLITSIHSFINLSLNVMDIIKLNINKYYFAIYLTLNNI